MNKFAWLKTYFSPFLPIKPKLYIGKVAVGTPYFFPRKCVNNKEKPGYMKCVPKKIGFDFVGLGWKTKWSDDDFRLEYNPIWSFVFFKTSVTSKVYYGVPEILRKGGAKYWTQAEIIKLIDAYNEEKTPAEIAKAVGGKRTAGACMGKIAQLRKEQEAIKATLEG